MHPFEFQKKVMVKKQDGTKVPVTEYALQLDRDKVDKHQGQNNALKTLVTNEDGDVILVDATPVQPGIASEIDIDRHLNVRYNPKTLEVDEENRLNVIMKDLNELPYVKRAKNNEELSALKNGDIFEWQGENTDDLHYGYFYRLQIGRAEYETITIPAGTKKLVYTNRFDNTIKVAYAIDEIAVNCDIGYRMTGEVYDANFKLIVNGRNTGKITLVYWPHSFIYSFIGNVLKIHDIDDVMEICRTTYDKLIVNTAIYGGFRSSVDTPSTSCILSDITIYVRCYSQGKEVWPLPVKLSEIITHGKDWLIAKLQRQGASTFDEDTFALQELNDVFIDKSDNIYYFRRRGGSGYHAKRLYIGVTENGRTSYIDPDHLTNVYWDKPIGSTGSDIIDTELFFDYNGRIEYTSEAITLRRRIEQYDEYGNPIKVDETRHYWQRIDTQPHDDLSEIENSINILSDNKINITEKGKPLGVAELDSNGKVPSSQLPSYVDDVLTFSTYSSFPTAGEDGKIYIDAATNKTYRWSGSAYVEISPSLALGETSSTAYRGDRGKTAYDHAAAKGSAFSSGLYKITTNAQGHVIAATPVTKADITALGIPGTDTNTTYSFSDKNPTLDWGKKSTVATVGGVDLHVTMPANPNTNTWRGIQNNLTSDSTTDSLAAAQGKVLKALIDKKMDSMVVMSLNCGSDVSGIQIGNICLFTISIRPSSSSVSIFVPGVYYQTEYFLAGNGNVYAVFRLTTNGFIENESPLEVGAAYYGFVVGVRKS